MHSFKDYLGVETKIGDSVVVVEKSYRNFITGKVLSVSAQMANIEYTTSQGYKDTLRANHNFIVRVPNQ